MARSSPGRQRRWRKRRSPGSGETPVEAAVPQLVDRRHPEPSPVAIDRPAARPGRVRSSRRWVRSSLWPDMASRSSRRRIPRRSCATRWPTPPSKPPSRTPSRPRRRAAGPGLARTDAGGRPRAPRGPVRVAGLLTHRHESVGRATLGRRARPGPRSDLRFPGPRVPCGCRARSRRGRRPRHLPPAEPALSLWPRGNGGAGPADCGRPTVSPRGSPIRSGRPRPGRRGGRRRPAARADVRRPSVRVDRRALRSRRRHPPGAGEPGDARCTTPA